MLVNSERCLASLQVIQSLRPIAGADWIEVAKVLGWDCVVKKRKFNVGDLVVYIEVDALLPVKDSRFDFLPKETIKNDDLGEGYLLRPAKMKGVKSFGLLLPLSDCPEITSRVVGHSVQDILNIRLWDPEISEPGAIGSFPYFIPKTSCERWQNIPGLFDKDGPWQSREANAEVKLNGKSRTVYLKNSEPSISSRRLELDWDFPSSGSKAFLEAPGLFQLLQANTKFAIQGELISSAEGVKDRFCVFDIFNIETGLYLSSATKDWFFRSWGVPEANRTPGIGSGLFSQLASNEQELMTLANGPKAFGKGKREGIVLKFPATEDLPCVSVKVINY